MNRCGCLTYLVGLVDFTKALNRLDMSAIGLDSAKSINMQVPFIGTDSQKRRS